MDRKTQLALETDILSVLCRQAGTAEKRLEILQSLEHHAFVEPEHRVIFESLRLLRRPVTPAALSVHLNNRGFPDVDIERYFEAGPSDMADVLERARAFMGTDHPSKSREGGFGKTGAAIVLCALGLLAVLTFFARPLRRAIRESLMESVASAHYRVLFDSSSATQSAMQAFATSREPLFASLNRKLGGAASNAVIKIIFNRQFTAPRVEGVAQDFHVRGMTVRARLVGNSPQLVPAADAEALLTAAWGVPGNPQIAYWTAKWLLEGGNDDQLGMAAADVDRNGSHKRVSDLLKSSPDKSLSPQDRATLGAAWIDQIAELMGPAQVEKLYQTKITNLNVPAVTAALGTSPSELERKWQMWIYAYIAGMGGGGHSMSMPMNMPMPTN